jgi:Rieske Fe-S protein
LAGLVGFGGLIRFFSFRPDPGVPSRFEIGGVEDFPPGKEIIRPEIPAMIFNRDGQIQALSLSCTHLGCVLEKVDDGFSCPCHGSQFDGEGILLNGPAQENLRPLQVEIREDQTIILHTKGAGK